MEPLHSDDGTEEEPKKKQDSKEREISTSREAHQLAVQIGKAGKQKKTFTVCRTDSYVCPSIKLKRGFFTWLRDVHVYFSPQGSSCQPSQFSFS